MAPSIVGWMTGTRARQRLTLGVAALIIAGAQVAGARVDWRVYAVLAVWVAWHELYIRWAMRPFAYERRLRRYAWSVAGDVLFLGVTYFFLDGAQLLGVVFFSYMALVASATLPRRWSRAISALIVVVYTALLLLSVYGPRAVPSPAGLPPVRGNGLFVVAGVASAIGMVFLLVRIQRMLIKSIRDAETRYLTLVHSASDMVMTFDEGGHFLDVNPATVEQSGYSWEEIKRLPNESLFPPEDWPRVRAALARALAGEAVRTETRYIRKSGEARWMQSSVSPILLDGKPAVVVIARDVTDAQRQQAELRERDERFTLVLDSLGAGFVTFDHDLRATSALGEWVPAYEAAHGAVAGKHIRELGGVWGFTEEHELAAARVLVSGERVTFERRISLSSGERRLRTRLVPLRGAGGEIVGGAGFWVDETELARAEAERTRLRQQLADTGRVDSLGSLVSRVAHELNNPLAAILNFTEDMLADARLPEERVALEVIQSQALRSRTIVRDLLTYSRSDGARPRVPVEPGPVLETLVRAMRPGLALQGVTLDSDIAAGAPPIPLDRAGFEQVVTNLVTNAAHAAGSGGSVRITSRVRPDAFEVAVDDNGPGIPPDVIEQIFEPFFTTKATGHGVGLGLSVSLGIVTAHGGTLAVQNRPTDLGGGARFTLRLPLGDAGLASSSPKQSTEAEAPMPRARGEDAAAPRTAADHAPVSEPLSAPRAMPDRKNTILIVDDESPIRQALSRYFARKGWIVEEAADGADALTRLLRPEAQRIYSVVLCDLKMPGVSGMDVYERTRAAAAPLAERFILSTGDSTSPDVAAFVAAVAAPVIEKPFELRALDQVVEQVWARAAGGPPGCGPALP